jgi:hypothetical protein
MRTSQEPLCRLLDTRAQYLQPNGEPVYYAEVPVYSLGQLEQLLRSFAARQPRMLDLRRPRGGRMSLGIGGDVAGIIAYPIRNPPPGDQPSWMAQACRPYTDRPAEFIGYDQPQYFEASALMPAEEVIRIVLHFVARGELPDTHHWLGPPDNRYFRPEPDRGGGREHPADAPPA